MAKQITTGRLKFQGYSFSKHHLLMFALIFALVGGYSIIKLIDPMEADTTYEFDHFIVE